MKTVRLQTLTDGVFAIVMTLLVFDLRPPNPNFVNDEATMMREIAQLLPSFASYLISFIILGVYWIGHHTQFQYIRRADPMLLWLNIIFLMCVSLVPFSAGLMGRFQYSRAVVIVYGINLICVALSHYVVWRYATFRNRLVETDLPAEIIKLQQRLSLSPLTVYGLAIAASFVDPRISVFLYLCMLVPYVLGILYHHQLQTQNEEG